MVSHQKIIQWKQQNDVLKALIKLSQIVDEF
jgi:hypothetical protein